MSGDIFMPWILRCKNCGKIRKLYVGYDLSEEKQIYVYCAKCRKNTFHEILKYEDDAEAE